ncbi:hypothetical protein Cni_G26804 [Canna indica]|uniref:Non-specific lipid-transfer protein n=1 Tax=Canna indica TaxID=4628 RepID=A0AAQ3L4G3_9LILI|nr:hypothetical protein Cni_G26804 [Canna indica]
MARSSSTSLLAVMVVAGLLIAAGPPAVRADVTSCGQVIGYLMGCLNYAQGMGPLTGTCCSGVRDLNTAARTKEDRQTTCRCLKQSAGAVQGLQLSTISQIPAKCGVNVPYSISPTTDCSKQVHLFSYIHIQYLIEN